MTYLDGIAFAGVNSGSESRALERIAAAASKRCAAFDVITAPGLAVLHSGGSTVCAAAGDIDAWLWRPAGESRSADTSIVQQAAARVAAGQWEPRDAPGGAFLLLLRHRQSGQVAIATDRFGICQLYYHANESFIRFSTSLDAVRADAPAATTLDPQAIYSYVFFHCIPAPRTIYRGIAKMEPAGTVNWHCGTTTTANWWTPTFATETKNVEVLAAQLPPLLEEAVAQRAGPHTGAFLSGGLDSSSIAGMLARRSPGADTFTIGFDVHGYDESGYARIAAGHFQTTHHEYFVTPADVHESLGRIAGHFSEPFGNSSVIPTYHCARFARESGMTRLLAGDGGDELFAGNSRYVEQNVFERYSRVPAPLRATLELGYRLFPILSRLPIARKGAGYISQAKMGLPDRLQSYNFLNRFDPRAVFGSEFLASVDTELPWQQWRDRYREPATADDLQRMLYLDWKFTLADNDLVKVGRMCELAGIEVSFPMLDDSVVDLSTCLSASALLPNGKLRGFYKHAFRKTLPGAIIDKSKHGFGLPFGVWMRDDPALQGLVQEAFLGMRRREIFSGAFLDDALRLSRTDSPGYYGELVWLVTMLELWFSRHGM